MVDLGGVLRADDAIVCGQASAEPQTLLEALVAQRAELSGCRLFLGAHYSGIVQPRHADHLRLASYGGIGRNRSLSDAGVLDVLRVPYSQLAPLIRSGQIGADVLMVQVSPPNARGEYSLGLAADYLIPALDVCRAIVAEVNDQVPWTHAERVLRATDFDLVIETSRPPARPRHRAPGTLEAAIGRHAAAFVPEGATLEFGVGALPEAVCPYLAERTGLRVHSGTVGDGVAALAGKGAIVHIDCAMLIGTSVVFEFARDNALVRLRSSEHTHGADVLARLERFVAVSSAVEVDLAGQVNSEIAGGSYVGAIGGAPDFVAAANRSPGGVSLVLIPATRLVSRLSAPATLPASEAGVVVTEIGAADLRGCDGRERARRLRGIASAHSAI